MDWKQKLAADGFAVAWRAEGEGLHDMPHLWRTTGSQSIHDAQTLEPFLWAVQRTGFISEHSGPGFPGDFMAAVRGVLIGAGLATVTQEGGDNTLQLTPLGRSCIIPHRAKHAEEHAPPPSEGLKVAVASIGTPPAVGEVKRLPVKVIAPTDQDVAVLRAIVQSHPISHEELAIRFISMDVTDLGRTLHRIKDAGLATLDVASLPGHWLPTDLGRHVVQMDDEAIPVPNTAEKAPALELAPEAYEQLKPDIIAPEAGLRELLELLDDINEMSEGAIADELPGLDADVLPTAVANGWISAQMIVPGPLYTLNEHGRDWLGHLRVSNAPDCDSPAGCDCDDEPLRMTMDYEGAERRDKTARQIFTDAIHREGAAHLMHLTEGRSVEVLESLAKFSWAAASVLELHRETT